MRSKIVFSDGVSVMVNKDLNELQQLLERDRRKGSFTQLELINGRKLYVAADRVAYVEDQGGNGEPGVSDFGP
jgi:hypothetical protein